MGRPVDRSAALSYLFWDLVKALWIRRSVDGTTDRSEPKALL